MDLLHPIPLSIPIAGANALRHKHLHHVPVTRVDGSDLGPQLLGKTGDINVQETAYNGGCGRATIFSAQL